jgi:hypothetical protein
VHPLNDAPLFLFIDGLMRATSLIAVGPHQLHVGLAARSGELGEYEGKCSKSLNNLLRHLLKCRVFTLTIVRPMVHTEFQ